MLSCLCCRPSTPINEILEFKFQDDWITQQRQLQESKKQKEEAKVIMLLSYLCVPGVATDHIASAAMAIQLWHIRTGCQ